MLAKMVKTAQKSIFKDKCKSDNEVNLNEPPMFESRYKYVLFLHGVLDSYTVIDWVNLNSKSDVSVKITDAGIFLGFINEDDFIMSKIHYRV